MILYILGDRLKMGKDTPFIMEGDDEADIEISLIKACGINYENYAEDESILTREIFEAHFDILLEKVNRMNHYIGYLIFGSLILKTGSKLPEELREKIFEAADWKNDRKDWRDASEDFLELRKEILIDFQEKIKNHKPGVITDVM